MLTPPMVRVATPDDAAIIAGLLVDFNIEFDVTAPPVEVLTERLRRQLAGPLTRAILAGTPAVGVAVVQERTGVWFDGPVWLLEELYVRPDLRSHGIGGAMLRLMHRLATERGVGSIEINVDESDLDTMRFYRREGFTDVDPESGERAYYFWRDLA